MAQHITDARREELLRYAEKNAPTAEPDIIYEDDDYDEEKANREYLDSFSEACLQLNRKITVSEFERLDSVKDAFIANSDYVDYALADRKLRTLEKHGLDVSKMTPMEIYDASEKELAELTDIGHGVKDTAEQFYDQLLEASLEETERMQSRSAAYIMPYEPAHTLRTGHRMDGRFHGEMVISKINGYPVKGKDLADPEADFEKFEPLKISDGDHMLTLRIDDEYFNGFVIRGDVDGNELPTRFPDHPSFSFKFDGMKNYRDEVAIEDGRTIHRISPDTQFAFKASMSIDPKAYIKEHASDLEYIGFSTEKAEKRNPDVFKKGFTPQVRTGEKAKEAKKRTFSHDEDSFGR